MALPTLNWKFVGAQGASAATFPALNQAIYQLGTSARYADGTTRTPGSGSAWTWTREVSGPSTVAVYGAAPTVTPVGMRYILAGDGATAPATLLTPDTSIATTGYVGMNRGAGAYTSWSAAQPFTSGFSGYWRGFGGPLTLVPTVYLYESQEACALLLTNSAAGIQLVLLGALFDPLTATNVESDGRLYFMQTPGYGINLGSSFLSSATVSNGSWGNHSTTANQSHFGYFTPGLTTVTTATRGMLMAGGTPGVSLNGDVIKIPFYVVNAAGAFVGQSRSVSVVRDYQATAVVKDGATQQGCITAYSPVSAGDAVMLEV